jgi:dTDP-glucose 4,6-dehydratase
MAIISFLIKEKVPLHGGGESVRSFIHMNDVSKATNLILNYGNLGNIYHISTKQNISIKSLVKMIAKQLDIPFEKNVEITEDRKGKDSAYLLDSSKLRESLNWQDTISLEEGIEKTIGWVKNNLEELLKQPMNYIHKQ